MLDVLRYILRYYYYYHHYYYYHYYYGNIMNFYSFPGFKICKKSMSNVDCKQRLLDMQ